MPTQNLFRGILLAGVALPFGIGALRMPLGRLSEPGPGLFPLIVACLLLVLALSMIGPSFRKGTEKVKLNFKNISLILLSLAGFVILTANFNMALGTVWLVFVSTIGGVEYNFFRNAKLSVALIIIGLILEKFFGLNLGML